MKKILSFLCIFIFSTTIYAADTSNFTLENQTKSVSIHPDTNPNFDADFIRIQEYGNFVHITDEFEKNEILLTLNSLSLQSVVPTTTEERKLQPVAGFRYRIFLENAGQETKSIAIYSSGKVSIAQFPSSNQAMEFTISDTELEYLFSILQPAFETHTIYHDYYPFDTNNITKLGMILHGKLHFFENARIHTNGYLYLSLDDWNSIFSKTYGTSKELIMQNNQILYHGQATEIRNMALDSKTYIMLRDAIDFFQIFRMEWDAQLKKVIVCETALWDRY